MDLRILSWALLLFVLQIDLIDACGGCNGNPQQESACPVTKTRKVSYRRSSWWRRTVAYRLEYFVGYQCCDGYDLQGSTCRRQTVSAVCGGCEDSTISVQLACSRTVLQTRTVAQYYSCGYWPRRTCVRYIQQYYYATQTYCCSQFELRGRLCHSTLTTTTTTTAAPPAVACGTKSASGPAIVGGADAEPCEFPWQISLRTSGHICGGTILSARWVITAAHCVEDTNYRNFVVRVGEHSISNWDTPQVDYRLSQIRIHPSYGGPSDGFFRYDLALLETSSPMTFGDCVRPICLPQSPTEVNSQTTIVGWGQTAPGPRDSSSRADILQKANVVVVSPSSCSVMVSDMSTFLCVSDGSGNNQISSCFGDSGSGMYDVTPAGSWSVIGVASFVSSTGCATGLPFGYANVDVSIQWIRQVTGL